MPGPRYVKDFEYPSSFGFTGSASDRATVPVRPHERAKPQRYARGGKVTKTRFAEGGIIDKLKSVFGSQVSDKEVEAVKNKTPPVPPVAKGDTIQAPKSSSAADAMKNQTERRMKELGLKRGGKVKHRKSSVRMGPNPDLAIPSPQDPDNATAPMAKRGGRIRRAMGGPIKASKGGMKKGRC